MLIKCKHIIETFSAGAHDSIERPKIRYSQRDVQQNLSVIKACHVTCDK